MKKTILFTCIIFCFFLSGCNSLIELKVKGIIEDYYDAIIDGDYEASFENLHLYDYESETENHLLSEGTTLSKKEAKAFYLEKVEVLKELNYKLIEYSIGEPEYADGHTFWYHVKLTVEIDGQVFEGNEVAHLYEGKLLVGGRDDPYMKYRDGKMNFDIEKELEKDGF